MQTLAEGAFLPLSLCPLRWSQVAHCAGLPPVSQVWDACTPPSPPPQLQELSERAHLRNTLSPHKASALSLLTLLA